MWALRSWISEKWSAQASFPSSSNQVTIDDQSLKKTSKTPPAPHPIHFVKGDLRWACQMKEWWEKVVGCLMRDSSKTKESRDQSRRRPRSTFFLSPKTHLLSRIPTVDTSPSLSLSFFKTITVIHQEIHIHLNLDLWHVLVQNFHSRSSPCYDGDERSQIGDEMNYTTYSIARDVLPESKCWPCLVFRFQHQIGFQAAHLNLLFPPCLHLRFDSWFDFEKCVMNSINVLGTVHIILWVSTYIFQCIFVCFFFKKKNRYSYSSSNTTSL